MKCVNKLGILLIIAAFFNLLLQSEGLAQKAKDEVVKKGKGVEIEQIIENFKNLREWHKYDQFCMAKTSFEISKEPVHKGKYSGKFSYEVTSAGASGQGYVSYSIRSGNVVGRALKGRPIKIGMWVYGNRGGESLVCRLIDRNGETYQMGFGIIDWRGWKYLERPISEKLYHYGGDKNGIIDYPLRFDSLLLDGLGKGDKGVVYFDDLEAITTIPQRKLLNLNIKTSPVAKQAEGLAKEAGFAVISRPSSSRPSSPFGINFGRSPYMEKIGIKWVRREFKWKLIEPKKGEYHWNQSDQYVDKAEKNGIEILALLDYSSFWASTAPPDAKGRETWPPKKAGDYANYVYQVVNRYKDRIRYWEIWNEPDLSGFWHGTAKQYVELLKAAYAAAKRADPNSKVLLAGLDGGYANFLDRVLLYGGGKYFDIEADHPYSSLNGCVDRLITRISHVQKLLKSYGYSKPIWITEDGISTNEVTPHQQAEYLIKTYITSLAMGIKKIFWYQIGSVKNPEAHENYGLLNYDRSPRPAYFAYKTLVTEIYGTQYLGSLNLGKNIWAHVFVKDDRDIILVAWVKKGKSKLSLEVGSKNIQIEDITGKLRRIDVPRGKLNLILTESPVFIKGARKKIILENRRFKRGYLTGITHLSTVGKKFKGSVISVETGVPPKIDADLSEWKKVEKYKVVLNRADQVKMMHDWQGPSDLSATFYSMWDKAHLYLAIKVKDNVFCQPYHGGNVWNGDSIQFAIDTLPDDATSYYSVDDYEYGLALTPKGPQVYRWAAPIGQSLGLVKDARLAVRKTKSGLIYEAGIPVKDLSPLKLSIGKKIGFSFLINDNDGKGRRGWIEWSSGIGQTKDPRLFGDMVFVGSNYVNR